MIIAIPVNGKVLHNDFSKATHFDIAELDFGKQQVLNPKSVDLSHAKGGMIKGLEDQGVEVVVCGEIDPQSVENLNDAGIQIVSGAPEIPSDELFNALLQSALADMGCGCGCQGQCGEQDCGQDPGHGGCGCR